MRILKLLSITFLLACLIFGTMVACDGDDGDGGNGELAGETECADMMDNDNDGQIDCEDIDCILDENCVVVTCDDFVDAFCDRAVECDGTTFEDCVLFVELFISSLDCSDFEDLPTANQCIADLDDFDCESLNNDLGPDSCAPSEGVCEVCAVDEDCGEGLICVDCLEDCTGVAKRCVGFFFDQVCEDGTFGFLPAL